MQRTLTIVDNFYTNPNEVREYALSLPYSVRGNYPGYRTKSFLGTPEAESTKKRFEDILNIDIYNWDNLGEDSYNTAFQLTYDCDKTWIHRDINEYAGVLYLTPDAPCSGGTSFYRHIETNNELSKQNALLDYTDTVIDNASDKMEYNTRKMHKILK